MLTPNENADLERYSNMNLEHKKRWLTAIFGLLLNAIVYFYLRQSGVVLLTFVISSVALFEYLHFSGKMLPEKWLTLGLGLALSVWLNLGLAEEGLATSLCLSVLIVDSLLRTHRMGEHELKKDFWNLEFRFFGIIYLILFPSYISRIHGAENGPSHLLLLFLIIGISDTAAYYGGKIFGRHKLSPFISPGKTREGSLTALAVCTLFVAGFAIKVYPEVAVWKFALVGLTTSMVAQLGDLVESFLKRAYAVKDSGNLLPGHGGFFDRFDSLILAAPFFYLLVRFFL